MKILYKGKQVNSYRKEISITPQTSPVYIPKLIAQYKFDKSIYENLVPEFNAEFTNYEIVDKYLDTENIVTRSIYSNSLPTMVRFGNPDDSNEGTEESKAKFKAIIELLYLDGTNITTCELMFHACNNINYITPFIITDKCTNMSGMLSDCQSLTTLDVSNFNTSNVTNMNSMFYQCNNLTTLDLSKFNTSNVTDMYSMFSYCYNLTTLDVSNFNTSNVTNMRYMFNNCYSLTSIGDISNWAVDKVTDMAYMFNQNRVINNLDLSKWNISKVANLANMFYNCTSLIELDLTDWDFSNVTNMDNTFNQCTILETVGDSSNWNLSNVTTMICTFRYCYKLKELNVRDWDMSNCTTFGTLFYKCYELKELDTSLWVTNKVTSTDFMFGGNNFTELDLSNFSMNLVTNIRSMFYLMPNLETLNISNWHLDSVTNKNTVFNETTKLKTIYLNNSDANTINLIISILLSRSVSDPGVIYITGVDDISQVNIEAAQAKYWNIIED